MLDRKLPCVNLGKVVLHPLFSHGLRKRKMNGMRMVLGDVRPGMARQLGPKGRGQNV